MEILQHALYQYWAERKFLDIIAKMSDQNWINHIPGFTKSVQEIYIHKYDLLCAWLHLLLTNSSKKVANIPEFESMPKAQFVLEAQKILEQLVEYIKHSENIILTIEDKWVKKPYQISSHEVLFNTFNHLTYHRGQTALMFKRLGFEAPETDYIPFLYEIKKLT